MPNEYRRDLACNGPHRLISIDQIKNFKDYVELYTKGKMDDFDQPLKVVYETVNDRWEVGITSSNSGFQQVSFVNSIATTKVSWVDLFVCL